MLDLLHARAAVWLTQSVPGFANHVWRATLFALLVVAVVRLGRPPRRSRQLLYALAFSALWIPVPFLDGAVRALRAAVSQPAVRQPTSMPVLRLLDSVAAPVPPPRVTWIALEQGRPRAAHDERLCLALLLWLAGCVWSLTAWLRRLRSSRVPSVPELPESRALARFRAHFHVRRRVRMVISEDCREPAVHGHMRPVILVPADLNGQMSETELEALLAHEIAHVARADNLRSSLARVASGLLWFHPLAWWLAARLGEERELACDERALAATRDPDSYVGALQKAVRLCIARPIAGAAAAGGAGVGRRLEQLLARDAPGRLPLWRRLILSAAFVGSIAFLVVLPAAGRAGLAGHLSHGRFFEQDMRGIGPGTELPFQQVGDLERVVASAPDNLEARGALLRHYWTLIGQSRATREIHDAHERHVSWLIEHEPASGLAGSPFAGCFPWLTAQAQARAHALWLNALTAAPHSADVLHNAAVCFGLIDRPLELRVLEEGRRLEPLEPYWQARLGSAHLRQASIRARTGNVDARTMAEVALAELESARELLPDSSIRSGMLMDVSRAAWLAGDTAKTLRYATALVNAATASDSNYGRVVHDGNVILGELALASGDVTEATRRLGMAGQTPGDPGLNTVGPDLGLASRLLERGEREAVIQYLEACARFWARARPQLADAIREIRSGGTPQLDRRMLAGRG